MPFVPWPDVVSVPDLLPGTPFGDMMRKAATVADIVGKAFPSWANPVPGFLFPAQRGIESLSEVSIPLPPPIIPPTGGQCCNLTYEVTYQYKSNGTTVTNSVQVTGRVGSGKITSTPDGLLSTYIPYYSCDGVERRILAWGNVDRGAFADGLYTFAKVIAIIPVGGVPDNCGNAPPYYEPTLPKQQDLTFVFPIVIAPGVTIPINFVYVKPEVDINLNIDARVNIPVTVNLPDVGINFNFDLGGINIQIGGSNPVFLPTKPDTPTPQPKPSPTPPDGDFNLNQVIKRLAKLQSTADDIKDCACDEEGDVLFQDFAPEESGVFNLPGIPVGCQLTLTTVVANNKNQDGGTAPDVVYSGWAWYRTSQGGLSERTPIDATQKYFPAVPGTTQFCYTCYRGNQARLRVYYRNPQP